MHPALERFNTFLGTRYTWVKHWWSTRLERRKAAALREVREFAQALMDNPDFLARRQAVDHLVLQRVPTPDWSVEALTQDPVVARMAELGIELRAPIRGISTRGRNNPFVEAIQEWAEPLRQLGPVAATSNAPAWAAQPTEDEQEANEAERARWEAAKVLYLYQVTPDEAKPEFLDLVVGLVCDQDREALAREQSRGQAQRAR